MAQYEGGVRLTRPDATLTADVVEAYSDDADGRRELVRLVATGSVAVKHGGSFGTARTAELLNDRSILVLRDEEGLAEVVETATGRSMRGRTLTYDLASDRIFTESVSGGRTWITLAPDGKDAPAVDPKTRH
jgi:lipopolysaccharide export system protein LptA